MEALPRSVRPSGRPVKERRRIRRLSRVNDRRGGRPQPARRRFRPARRRGPRRGGRRRTGCTSTSWTTTSSRISRSGCRWCRACGRPRRLPLDCHLMIENPWRWAMGYAEAGAHTVTFHAEAADDPVALAKDLRAAGTRVGLARRPGHAGRAVPGDPAPLRHAPGHDDQGGVRRPGVPARDAAEGARPRAVTPTPATWSCASRSTAASTRTRSARPGRRRGHVRGRDGGVRRAGSGRGGDGGCGRRRCRRAERAG